MVSYVKFSGPLKSQKVIIRAIVIALVSIGIVAAVVITWFYNQNSTNINQNDSKSSKTDKTVNPVHCNDTRCEIIQRFKASLDRSADPCTDFYQYACGGWISKHPIPSGKTEVSTVSKLQDRLFAIGREIIQNSSIQRDMLDSEAKFNAFKLFRSCMDLNMRNTLGTKPIKDLIKTLGGFITLDTYYETDEEKRKKINYLMQAAMREANISPLFTFGISADEKNSKENILQIQNPKGAFFENVKYERFTQEEFQLMYKSLIKKLLLKVSVTMSDYDSDDIARELFEFEQALQRIMTSTKSSTKYYKTTLLTLTRYMPTVNWWQFFNLVFNGTGVKVELDTDIILLNAQYLSDVDLLLSSTTRKTIHNFILLKTIMKHIDALPEEITSLMDKLTTALRGDVERPPQWQTCLTVTDQHLGMALGAMFVQKVFSQKGHIEANDMVRRLREAFKEILPSLSWLDNETREAAKEKIDAIVQQIGYPPYIMEPRKLDAKYEGLNVSDSYYFKNMLYLDRYKVVENFKLLGKPVDQNIWLQTPATINAYYNPRTNHIVFPAGILQAPYFGTDYPKAINYGGIGSVIGHEMTHGFDNKGRHFDKFGNFRDADDSWWSAMSVEFFNLRTQCFINQYSYVEVAGKFIDGSKTLAENIADNGGINIAYKAYKNWVTENGEEPVLPGVAKSNDQLFFLSFAQFYCSKKTNRALVNQLASDVHSPNMARVRETVQNSPEFARVFNCPFGSQMNPVDKCKLW